MSVFLSLSNVALGNTLLAEPLSENITHALRWEGNWEGVVSLIACHGGNRDILRVVEVWEWGVVDTQKLGDFTNTIGSVVEEEEGIVIYNLPVSISP